MNTFLSQSAKKSIAYSLIILTLFYTVGCKYFKVKDVTAKEFVTIDNIGKIHKSFYVHDEGRVYSLTDIQLDSLSISGTLTSTIDYRLKDERGFRYKKYETSILNEVHIYLKEGVQKLSIGSARIPLEDIKGIDIVDKDMGKTAASYTFGTFGVILGIVTIIVIIVALTKSSCPYVYAHDGDGYVFEGEIYGGAIAANLQREDYMPLQSLHTSEDDIHRIRISNELKERQYTDLAELIVVEHGRDQKILLDKEGKPHLIQAPLKPVEAVSYGGENLLPPLSKIDKSVFFFNDEDYSKNAILMKFDKPGDAKQCKLILHGKNTLWFDYQFGEFLSLFGGFYDEYMDQQKKIPSEERTQRILDNDFPLSIYVKENGTWKLVDFLYTIGPLASRDFVVPVDLMAVMEDQVEIKLETGFMFWELDFAGMDFTADENVNLTYLKPVKAIGTGSADWTRALSFLDKEYMAQEQVGEVTEVVYRAKIPAKDHAQTYFLHTSGYYELVREFEGLPNIVELNKFKKNGYFSDFSRMKYLQLLNRENSIASIKSIN